MSKQQLLHTNFAKKTTIKSSITIDTLEKRRRIALRIIFGFAFVWVGVVVMQLFRIQISEFDKWQDWALRQHFSEMKLASERGPISDRNNNLMAVSIPVGSVYVRPRQIKSGEREQVAKRISNILGKSTKEILPKLAENKPFVWVERMLPRAKAERVAELGIAGVGYVVESKRAWPYNTAGGTLLGKVGIDGNGLSGLERQYEKVLHKAEVKTKFVRDAHGNRIQAISYDKDSLELPKGEGLKLTLDADIQQIVDEELEAGRASANAKSAMAILTDANTGEVIALSQSPSVNLNRDDIAPKALKNIIAETVYEPGSTMKPLVAAAALDEKVVSLNEMIDCQHGKMRVGPHIIKDAHPIDTVTFQDVLIRSSNIGMTKIGQRLGKDRLYSYLKTFGFGKLSELKLPGETGGILRSPNTWALVDVATHSFGQGVAVTPLQMMRAYGALVNGGMLMPLRLVENESSQEYKRILSEKSANTIRDILYSVVEDEHGTGKLAAISGVRIGGKTGTAQKANPNGRGYLAGKYMASFIGFADATTIGVKNNYLLLVIVDEPSGGSIYGGSVAGPVFKRIMQRTLQFIVTRDELSPPANNKTVSGLSTVSLRQL